MTFAVLLKSLRLRDKLSQRELAAKLKISPSAVGMYESGQRLPSRETEEAIADFFNVSISLLRGNTSAEEPTELEAEFSKLDVDMQKQLLAYAKFLKSQKDKSE